MANGLPQLPGIPGVDELIDPTAAPATPPPIPMREPLSPEAMPPEAEQELMSRQEEVEKVIGPPKEDADRTIAAISEADPNWAKNKPLQKEIQKQLDSPQNEQLRKRLMKATASGLDDQIAQLDSFKDQLQAFKQFSPQLDLSPVMALVDSQTGSDLMKGYTRPKTQFEHQRQIKSMELDLLKRKKEIQGERTKLLKADNSAKWLQFQVKQQHKQEQDDLKQTNRLSGIYTKQFVAPIEEATGALASIEAAINTGNVRRIKSQLAKIAKTLNGETGALSEGDVTRQDFVDAFTNMKANLNSIMGTLKTQASPETIEMMRDFITEARSSIALKLNTKVQGLRGTEEPGKEKYFQVGAPAHLMEQNVSNQIRGFSAGSTLAPMAGGERDLASEAKKLSKEDIKAELAKRRKP